MRKIKEVLRLKFEVGLGYSATLEQQDEILGLRGVKAGVWAIECV